MIADAPLPQALNAKRQVPVAVSRSTAGPHILASDEKVPGDAEHFQKVLHDEVRQHEAVVQRRAPADQRLPIGHFPEAGDQAPAPAIAASGSSARAAAFRNCGTRPGPAGPVAESGE